MAQAWKDAKPRMAKRARLASLEPWITLTSLRSNGHLFRLHCKARSSDNTPPRNQKGRIADIHAPKGRLGLFGGSLFSGSDLFHHALLRGLGCLLLFGVRLGLNKILSDLPIALPSFGRFFGPKINRTTTRMIRSSGVPIPRIFIAMLLLHCLANVLPRLCDGKGLLAITQTHDFAA